MFEEQKRKREYKKRLKKYEDGISLEELTKTLESAEKIINILLEKSINDFLLFYNSMFPEEPHILKYSGKYIWSYSKIISPAIYCTNSDIPYSIYGSFENDNLCDSIQRFLGFFINKEKYYYYKSLGLETDNFDSLIHLFNNVQKINAIIYKNKESKIKKSYYYINDDVFSYDIEFEFIKDKNYTLNKGIRIKDEYSFLKLEEIKKEKVQLSIQQAEDNNYLTYYFELLEDINEYSYLLNNEDLSFVTENMNSKILLSNTALFDKYGKIKEIFLHNNLLEYYDLSNINFDNQNISGLDISHNPEVHINFDKIVKDLTDSSINGYNLNKYTFRSFNLTNTDLRNTCATIDLATCMITLEGKMSSGTIFDEDNKFIFGDKKLTLEQVKDLGIKIKKLERN
ncbi:MAG: hypothetical protein ACI4OT_01495 [Bacilli bacterium]